MKQTRVLLALLSFLAIGQIAAQAAPSPTTTLPTPEVLEVARGRALARRPASPPSFLGPEETAEELRQDFQDLRQLDASELSRGDWRMLRNGEDIRHLSWSGDGGALAWVDLHRQRLRVWMLDGEPATRQLSEFGEIEVVDYLTLNHDGTQALLGAHHFQRSPQLLDQLDHYLVATDGPSRVMASSDPSPHMKLSGACFAGDRVLLLETRLGAAGPLAPWSLPAELQALWFSGDFESPWIDMDLRGVAYTLLESTPTRALPPTWAAAGKKVLLGMGVGREDNSDSIPVLVLRGLKQNGSHPGAFAVLGQAGSLEFEVPGAPLSLAAAPDGSVFAYTHGPAGGILDEGYGPGFKLAEDDHYAATSRGIWFLIPGQEPVFVPHPTRAPCYQVAWRPNGLELAVATDLDEDGHADVCLYDLTTVLRNHQRRKAVLAEIAEREKEKQEAAKRAQVAQEAARRKAEEELAKLRAEEAKQQAEAARLRAAEEERLRQEAARAAALEATHQAERAAAEAEKRRAQSVEEADQQLAAGNFEKAAAAYRSLAAKPGLPPEESQRLEAKALLADGRAKLAKSQIGPGLADLARSVGRWESPENPAYPQLVQECLDRKLYSDGLRFADQWIGKGAGDEAQKLKVRLHSGAGEHTKAQALAEALMQQNSFSAPEKVLFGDALLSGGQAERALLIYQEAKTLAPDHPDIDNKIFAARAQAAVEGQGP